MTDSLWPVAANGAPYMTLIWGQMGTARRETYGLDQERSFPVQTGPCNTAPEGAQWRHYGQTQLPVTSPPRAPRAGLWSPTQGRCAPTLHQDALWASTAWARPAENPKRSIRVLDHPKVRREALSLQDFLKIERKDLRVKVAFYSSRNIY